MTNSTVPLGELLDMDETAQRLKRPVATLRWWRHRGEGPRSFLLGRRVMYRAADVDAWIAEHYTADSRGST